MNTAIRTKLTLLLRERITEVLSLEDMRGKGKFDVHSVEKGPAPNQISIVAGFPSEDPHTFTLTIEEDP